MFHCCHRLNLTKIDVMDEYSINQISPCIAILIVKHQLFVKVISHFIIQALYENHFVLHTTCNNPGFEERAAVVRVLSHWWTLNHRFFDYLTPNPIYHLPSRYPGVRAFRELSDQLVCDLYCQVSLYLNGIVN